MTTATDPRTTMSLLTSLFDDALRSDYPAEPNGVTARGIRIPRTAVGLALVVALVGFILATAVLTERSQRPTTAAQRDQLLERIEVAQADNVRIDGEIATRSAELDRLSREVLPSSTEGQSVAERLTTGESLAGYTAVSGRGVTVTLTESARATALERVMDRDLQAVTNGLWAEGATAIAINGVRLGGTTAIRSAGEAILVDYRPLTTPYVVTAVGPESLAADFVDGPQGAALRLLHRQYGIDWSMDTGDVEIPAATAALPQQEENAP